jgi:predicted  nucleic acid-binding Zn-ribbon protein
MDMSFAQALTEAKQVIVQQSNRIKSDADKIRQQQQTIVDQCATIADHEGKIKAQTSELWHKAESIEALESELSKQNVAREQAEAVIDRQGQRLSNFHDQVQMLEKRVTEQSDAIDKLTVERDAYVNQLPSKEDEEALAAMAALLTTKKAPRESTKAQAAMRYNGEARAEAA